MATAQTRADTGTSSRIVQGLRRAPGGRTTVVLLVALLLLAVIPPLVLAERAGEISISDIGLPPSPEHWLGTDHLGRDILARSLVAARLSLGLALGATAIGGLAGLAAGSAFAVLGERGRQVANRALHIWLSFPPIIIALFVAAVVGQGAASSMYAIGIAIAPGFARIAQTLTAQVSNADYVWSARLLGVPRRRILTRYVLPNIAEPLIIQATVAASSALVAVSALSFLGLGVRPPQYDWGSMLAEGLDQIFTSPIVVLAPTTAIVFSGLVFTFAGEALARSLNPEFWSDSPRPSRATGQTSRPTSRRSASEPEKHQPVAHAWPRPSLGPPLVDVDGLRVEFEGAEGPVVAVAELDLEIVSGEVVGLVGESGSGKSVTAQSLARLLPEAAVLTAETMQFEGTDLLGPDTTPRRRLLSDRMAMVFQDPMASLNPVMRVGAQMIEATVIHDRGTTREARARARERLRSVGMPAPDEQLGRYPHELSGGMRQRAMIAMGLMGHPSLLIADEPTTALDVTVQAQILELLRQLNRDMEMAVLFISHDLAVVGELCTRVVVMYAGRAVEDGPVDAVIDNPKHPYTKALLASVPDLNSDVSEPLEAIPGRPPAQGAPAEGCAFMARCPVAEPACATWMPRLIETDDGSAAACLHLEPSTMSMESEPTS